MRFKSSIICYLITKEVQSFIFYFRSDSFASELREVSLLYTQGHWSGQLGHDNVSISGLTSSFQAYIACILNSEQFFINASHWQGILGLAYSEIAKVQQMFFSQIQASTASCIIKHTNCHICTHLSKNAYS